MLFEKNLYKLLQVDPEADPDVIAAAYNALAGKLHPERDISGVADFRVGELKRAYAVLSDPGKRSAYDAGLARVAIAIGEEEGPGSAAIRSGGLTGRIAAQTGDNSGEEPRIDFGRYAGHTLSELLRIDPDYLRWLSRHSSGIRYRGAIMRLLAQHEAQRMPVSVRP